MQTFLSNLTQPLAHVVHIGAGAGEGVPAWREAGAKTITLIEGDPGIAELLEAQVGADDGVRVVQAVVSGDLRERAFRRMNFPDLNSLRAPTGLKELFPGLKTLSKELVQPVDPARLIAPLDLPDAGAENGTNLLVIEAPGEALGILKALAAADLLLRFDMIHLTEAREPLYNKAPPAADILSYLLEAGFSGAFEDNPDDPEMPWLNARLDRVALALKRRFEEMTAKLAQAEAGNATLSGDLERVTGEVGSLRAELVGAQKETAQVTEQLTPAQAELEQSRQQTGQLNGQIEGLNSQLAGVQAELAQEVQRLQAELAEATGEATGQVAQIETLENALKEARADGKQAGERGKQAEHRLGQARDEMLKAEGQINLIRDLLLHGAHL